MTRTTERPSCQESNGWDCDEHRPAYVLDAPPVPDYDDTMGSRDAQWFAEALRAEGVPLASAADLAGGFWGVYVPLTEAHDALVTVYAELPGDGPVLVVRPVSPLTDRPHVQRTRTASIVVTVEVDGDPVEGVEADREGVPVAQAADAVRAMVREVRGQLTRLG
jgi:hypothetical protein